MVNGVTRQQQQDNLVQKALLFLAASKSLASLKTPRCSQFEQQAQVTDQKPP